MVMDCFFNNRLFIFRRINLLAHTLNALFNKITGVFAVQKFIVKKNFAWFITAYFLNNTRFCFLFIFSSGTFKFACCNIAKTDSERIFLHIKAAYIVICAFFKHRIFNNRTRSYNAHYIPFYKAFCSCRILHLFTYGNLIAFFYKTRHIGLIAVIRNPAHGCAFFLTAFFSRKRKLQFFRSRFCVIIEHLIKVTQTEEKYSVFISAFYIKILLHHGRKLCQKNTFVRIIYIFYFIIIRLIVQEKR